MTDYALIKDGVVIATIVWDGVTEVDFGKGVQAVEIPESKGVTTGFLYTEGVFSAAPLTDEQLEQQKNAAITENVRKKDSLMSVATVSVAPLQDAVDLEMATDEEIKSLNAWKKYRVLLNRIDANTAGDIKWPAVPS